MDVVAPKPAAAAPVSRDPARQRARILDAARALFFSVEYEKVTTAAIARDARMSKSTVYKHFLDRDAIFDAVIDRESQLIIGPGGSDFETKEMFFAALEGFGRRLCDLLSRKDVMRFCQLMISQAHANPELARAFYANAYVRSQRALAGMIAAAQARGFAPTDRDATWYARTMLLLWEGTEHCEILFQVREPGYDDVEEHVRAGVRHALLIS